MKERIWLSSPHMGGREQEYVAESFATNWIAPLGPHVTAFERTLEEYTGVKHAVALSSGTAALHLALIMLKVQPGDIVFCQSKTFAASANPICYTGATPWFIDSEADSWNMDPVLLNEAIETCKKRNCLHKVKAIIPVHLYGMPARIDEIIAIARNYNIPVIEDAAESLGSTWLGKQTGSFADMSILSFNGNKIITTSGGGALLCNSAALAERARFLATQARDQAPHYEHSHIGYNYRLSNVCAGIGLGQMEVLNERIAQRRANAHRYLQFFRQWETEGFQVSFQHEREGAFSNRWLSCIVVDPASNNGLSREIIRLSLMEENIETRPLWKPMHMQPVFEGCETTLNGVSEQLFQDGLCLPSGSNLSEEGFYRITAALCSVFVAYRRKQFSVSV